MSDARRSGAGREGERHRDLDELLDRLVSEYTDRVAAGRAGELDDLLAQVPAGQQAVLRRCLQMVDAGAAPVQAPKPLVAGTLLGGCRILGTLGRGGMATVFRAEQLALKREVALKVLRPGLAVDPRQVERFRREGLAAARLEHPNVVRVHDVGAEAGHLFLVMEKIDGSNFAHALEKLPESRKRTAADFARAIGAPTRTGAAAGLQDPAEEGARSYERAVARFFAVIARAVAAAHARGIVHRDIKPSNILLKRDGTPVVADFGLAKGEGDLAFTLTGEPLGTPYYMSPEQVEQVSAHVDARTDVYSLGVTFYEALAGRRPFEGETAIALFDQIRRDLPPPLTTLNPGLSRDAEAVVGRAMARDPDQRYATAGELADDLDRLAQGTPVRARAGALNWRQAMAGWRQGQPVRYRSPQEFLGLPLLDVHFAAPRRFAPYGAPYRLGRAKGWIACGDIAVGGIAFGKVATGVFAAGVLAMGGVTLGGSLSIGLLAFGAVAMGGVALGGIAAGLVAVGGVAVGVIALGGVAAGVFALGGQTYGDHTLSGTRVDYEAAAFFDRYFRGVLEVCLPKIVNVIDRALGR